MSLSDILSSALSGLSATQAGLRTVSNNIANVNTPGYARERISLQPGVTAGRVNGVVVGEPERVVDRYLEAAVYGRAGDAAKAETTSTYLDRLQSLLGTSGAKTALPAQLDAISSAATALTAASGGTQTSAAFVGTVSDSIGSLQQVAQDVDGLRSDVAGDVRTSVDRINTLLGTIKGLNDSVARLDGLGRSSAGPADQRVAALQELSGLIGVTTRTQSDGRISIDTATGVPLLDQRLRQLSYASGDGTAVSQTVYPAIDVHFADDNGTVGAATGATIDSPAVGGALGGLLDLRDRQLPAFAEKLGTVFGGLAQTLNAASNAGTAVPAPASLTGRATSLAATDRLGFTGAATFAVTSISGTLVASARIDFSALGAGATVADAVTAINTGLGGAGTASFANGSFSIAAAATGNGIVVAQDATSPSARAGAGFSQYFGLNDIVQSPGSTLMPSGFTAADPTRFGAGQSAEVGLRDPTGKLVARYTLSGSTGPTFGDTIGELNASPLGGYGSFSLDPSGRVRFAPTTANTGASLTMLSDTTNRAGTGQSFSSIAGLTGDSAGLAAGRVRLDIAGDPRRLPLAQLQSVAVGQQALGVGDRRGATGFVNALSASLDLGKDGVSTIGRFASTVLGDAGIAASRAADKTTETAARRDDAITRRDAVSGVNIDEELAQMVVLQNSYSASARVVSTTNSMYDTLIGMMR